MKKTVDKKSHGKTIIMHLKRHHKKYLCGAFGGFALVKMFILFLGLSPALNIGNIFASNDEIILNADNWTENCDMSSESDGIIKCNYDTAHNRYIVGIEPGAFNTLQSSLKILNLSDNKISTIESGTFNWFTALTELHLENNRISDISTDAFTGVALGFRIFVDNNCLSDSKLGELWNARLIAEQYASSQGICLYVNYDSQPGNWTLPPVTATLSLVGNSEGIGYYELGNESIQIMENNVPKYFYVEYLRNQQTHIQEEVGNDRFNIKNLPANNYFPAIYSWIDDNPPECGNGWGYNPYPTNNWINESVTATLINPDDDESGIIPGLYTCTINEGQTGCSVVIEDQVGNTKNCRSDEEFKIDTTSPEVTLSQENGIISNNQGIIVKVSDDAAGLDEDQIIKYKWQTNSTCNSNDPNNVAINPSTLGTHEASGTISTAGLSEGSYYLCILEGSVHDRAGNTNTSLSKGQFTVDNTAPTCERGQLSPNSLQVGEVGTILLNCTDTGAGIQTMNLDSGDISFSEQGVLKINNITTGSITDGIKYTIEYEGIANGSTTLTLRSNKVQDNAGNYAGNGNDGSEPSAEISVSNGHSAPTEPLVSITEPAGHRADDQTITITRYAGATGSYRCLNTYAPDAPRSGGTYTPNFSGSKTLSINENHQCNKEFICAFGQTGGYITTACTQNPVLVDTSDPMLELTSPSDNTGFDYGNVITLSWNGSDGISGVSGYLLSITKPSGTVSFPGGASFTEKPITLDKTGNRSRSVTVYDKTNRYITKSRSFVVNNNNNNTYTGRLVSITEPAGHRADDQTITITRYAGATGSYRCLNTYAPDAPRSGGTYTPNLSGSKTLSINENHQCNKEFICAFGQTGGRTTTTCTQNPVLVDTSDPILDLISPRDNTGFDYGNVINLSWSGSDGISGVSGYLLSITKPSGTVSFPGGSDFTEKPITLDKTGNRSWSVTVYDKTNRTQNKSRSFVVNGSTGETPIYTGFYLIYPSLGELINLGNDVRLEWNQGTINSGYEWSVNKISGAEVAHGTTTSSTVTVNNSLFTTGAYTWSVRDKYSDTTKSIPVFFIVDESNIPDLEVREFEFDEIEDADLDEYYQSNTITIRGLTDGWYTFARLGDRIGALYINEEFVGTEGFVKNGDEVYIEMKASDEYDKTIKTTLFVGVGANTVSGDFKITTKDGIHTRDNPSLTPMQKLWGIIYVDSLVEMYQYDKEKLAIFLSTFMQLLQDKSDYYADKILEAEENGDDELAKEYKLYKEAIDFLYITVKYRYDNLDVEDRSVYIAPNGKQYLVEYDEDRMAYTSPDFARPKYFPTRELFTNHIDLNNPKVGSWGIVGNVITTHNGKVYTIYEKNGKWTSSNFKTAKYFDTKEDIINHILANNPASDRDHRIDTDFKEVKHIAPSGKPYTIFKTSSKGHNPNMYSSYDFVNAKYFTSLEAAKKFIDQSNPKK